MFQQAKIPYLWNNMHTFKLGLWMKAWLSHVNVRSCVWLKGRRLRSNSGKNCNNFYIRESKFHAYYLPASSSVLSEWSNSTQASCFHIWYFMASITVQRNSPCKLVQNLPLNALPFLIYCVHANVHTLQTVVSIGFVRKTVMCCCSVLSILVCFLLNCYRFLV